MFLQLRKYKIRGRAHVNFLTSSNIGNVRSISVNGVSKTFAAKSDKEIGIEADFYYTPGKNQIESEENYPAGTQIQKVSSEN